MPTLARNQASDPDNPELDVFFDINGVPTNVDSLEFEIFELVTDPDNPTKVFPAVGRETVDLTDAPSGDRLTTGRYVARYTPPLAEPIGNHHIRWYFQVTSSSPEQSFTEEFSVVSEAQASSVNGYTTIQALRDEGVTVAMASDSRLQTLIERVSRKIDMYTGRFFEPRSKTINIDGTGSYLLTLEEPIISISEVKVLDVDPFTSPNATLDIDDLKIFNRHLTQNLIDPDDRENPRIEFFNSEERYRDPFGAASTFVLNFFPRGAQNIEITGIFGYTEYDGTASGRTPLMIEHAAKLMVIRELPLLVDTDDIDSIRNRNRITKYKTRDQEIALSDSASGFAHQVSGMFTGDPEIDNILIMFTRPPSFGAA